MWDGDELERKPGSSFTCFPLVCRVNGFWNFLGQANNHNDNNKVVKYLECACISNISYIIYAICLFCKNINNILLLFVLFHKVAQNG